MEELLDGFEVRVGGTTSIDVTYKGMDKTYGIKKLLKLIKMYKKNTIFIGDALYDGGNDSSVKTLNIDCIEVRDHNDTKEMLAPIIAKQLCDGV